MIIASNTKKYVLLPWATMLLEAYGTSQRKVVAFQNLKKLVASWWVSELCRDHLKTHPLTCQ